MQNLPVKKTNLKIYGWNTLWSCFCIGQVDPGHVGPSGHTKKHKVANAPVDQSQLYDVAIVGGGMVGLALACSLGSNPLTQKLKVAIIDHNPALCVKVSIDKDRPPGSRVSTITPTTISLFKDIDAWKYVEKHRHAFFSKMQVGADSGKSLVRELAGFSTSGWTFHRMQSFALLNMRWRINVHGSVFFLELLTMLWTMDMALIHNQIQGLGTSCHGLERILSQQMSPLKFLQKSPGQGVNMGFQDAYVLSRVISVGIALGVNIGEESLLLKYEAERKPTNIFMAAVLDGFQKAYTVDFGPLNILRTAAFHGAQYISPLKKNIISYASGQLMTPLLFWASRNFVGIKVLTLRKRVSEAV